MDPIKEYQKPEMATYSNEEIEGAIGPAHAVYGDPAGGTAP